MTSEHDKHTNIRLIFRTADPQGQLYGTQFGKIEKVNKNEI